VTLHKKMQPHSHPVRLASLFPCYTHFLLASGAPIPTVHPSLPPVKHKIVSALDAVYWYTGHPDTLISSPTNPTPAYLPIPLPEHVTVVGIGNVALDVARIFLSHPSRLKPYGLPSYVMRALEQSKVKHVTILGRRGPREASFTAKELRELMNLEGVAFTGITPEILTQAEEGPKLERPQKRLLDILKKGSALKPGDPGVQRTFSIEFWRSPTAVEGVDAEDGTPMTLTIAHTAPPANGQKVAVTSKTSTLRTELIITALGHKSTSVTTPFCDDRLGHIHTVGGSYTHPETTRENGTGQDAANATAVERPTSTLSATETSTASPLASLDTARERKDLPADKPAVKPPAFGQVLHPVTRLPIPNVFATGWAGRGAKGVLGTTMLDAHSVAESMVEDWLSTLGQESRLLLEILPKDAEAPKVLSEGVAEDGPLSQKNLLDPRVIPPEVLDGLVPGDARAKDGVVAYNEWAELEAEEIRRSETGQDRWTWEDIGRYLSASNG
jgi:adrenodoxin-NADP+ reductase